MKLRNKKTGEIGRIAKTKTDDDEIEITTDTKVYLYKSISEVCQHWEDYEDPKGYWWISPLYTDVVHDEDIKDEIDQYNKEIGNYFGTREEAELAVRKLKAWKRLKDKGFRIDRWENDKEKYLGDFVIYAHTKDLTDIVDDLDLLFGGEE